MKTNAQQNTWAAAYNAALTGLLAGRPHRGFDRRQAKAFADLAEKDLNDYQTS